MNAPPLPPIHFPSLPQGWTASVFPGQVVISGPSGNAVHTVTRMNDSESVNDMLARARGCALLCSKLDPQEATP